MTSYNDPRRQQPGSAPTSTDTPTTFSPSALVNQPGGAAGFNSPGTNTGGMPSATSGGGPSSLGFGPYIPAGQQAEWAKRMEDVLGNAVYSVPGGGYISSKDAQNANSFYNKFGGHDPNVTKRVEDFYASLGALPTAPNLTPSASLLAAQTPGYTPRLGESINDRLGQPWQGPWGIDPNRLPEHVGFG